MPRPRFNNEALAHYRITHGLSQTSLAALIGVSQPSFSMWERGIYAPGYDYLPTIAGIMGVSVPELFTR